MDKFTAEYGDENESIGQYDALLIDFAESLRASNKTASLSRLSAALRDSEQLSLSVAWKIVEEFSGRGVLQAHFGPGLYDAWLTAQLETARQLNRGVNSTILARKLRRAFPSEAMLTDSAPRRGMINSMLGLADSLDIVNDYFLRYGLPPVLGPYPYYGIVVVTLTETLLFLPVLWAVHFALGFLLGHPLTFAVFGFVLLLFAGERLWRNWRKLRSLERWRRYDAARHKLPLP